MNMETELFPYCLAQFYSKHRSVTTLTRSHSSYDRIIKQRTSKMFKMSYYRENLTISIEGSKLSVDLPNKYIYIVKAR